MQTITKPKENGYTQGAWEGKLYDSSLDITDIAERVRFFLKKQYPACKFSITTQRYSGGRSMDIRLMSAPFEVFKAPSIDALPRNGFGTDEDKMNAWKHTIEKGHHQVNNYYIAEDAYLTEEAKTLFQFMNACAQAYNYDDSDGMIDYFDTNFYYHLSVGKWDKPFIKK